MAARQRLHGVIAESSQKPTLSQLPLDIRVLRKRLKRIPRCRRTFGCLRGISSRRAAIVARSGPRSEIDDRGASCLGLKFGLEDKGSGTVASFHAARRNGRSDRPSAVVRRPEQRGEARGRIEPRPAQRVDRSVGADQGHRFAVANDGVIFDLQRHGILSPKLNAIDLGRLLMTERAQVPPPCRSGIRIFS